MKRKHFATKKIKNNGKLYGLVHACYTKGKTVCNVKLTEEWKLLDKSYNNKLTCKNCIDILVRNNTKY